MLESVKISRRQSEIRQQLAALAAKQSPSEGELSSMDTLDGEYRANETRYRAALCAEDVERREAGAELETRGGREWGGLVRQFELRQAALHLDEGRALSGPTAEVVAELRQRGGYRGVPLPLGALEIRAGESVASGAPDPISTRPIIDRLFAPTVAARMGGQVISIESGETEWPLVTSSVAAGWANGEAAAVAGPTVFATTDRQLAPNSTLGITMRITRKALKQSGPALEDAIRRDMNSAIQVSLDRAAFLGAGANGEPLGVIAGAATYSITATPIGAAASWPAFQGAVTRFLVANAASGPMDARLLIRPEVWAVLDAALISGTAVSQWDRLTAQIGAENVTLTSNALAAPAGNPLVSNALLTTSAGGVGSFFIGLWGGVDLIRDPYSDATSGGLRLTGLLTADVTVARPAQLQILTGVQ